MVPNIYTFSYHFSCASEGISFFFFVRGLTSFLFVQFYVMLVVAWNKTLHLYEDLFIFDIYECCSSETFETRHYLYSKEQFQTVWLNVFLHYIMNDLVWSYANHTLTWRDNPKPDDWRVTMNSHLINTRNHHRPTPAQNVTRQWTGNNWGFLHRMIRGWWGTSLYYRKKPK